MPRGRREPPPNRWILPVAFTLTAAVATAGVYFWREMEDHEAATGFRSEDEETADEKRRSRGMVNSGRSFGDSAVAAGAGITTKVSEVWKSFFDGSSDESDAGRNKPGPSMSGPRQSSSSASGSFSRATMSRSLAKEVPILGNSQEVDWEKKKIIALVISSHEELDESLLLSLPTPVDISRWILLIFVYAPLPPPSPSLVQLSPRPMHRSPSPALSVKSYTSSKSFARTQPSPPDLSPETSPSLVPIRTPATSGRTSRADGILVDAEDDDDDMLLTPSLTSSRPRTSSFSRKSSMKGYSSASEAENSRNPMRRFGSFRSSRRDESDLDLESEETSVDPQATISGLILKTFGRDFPRHQVMHYSTPIGVVHMLRHLGVSLVFLSESCASIPSADNSSADEAPTNLPDGLPMSPPPGSGGGIGGGEIVKELKDWVQEIILVLDEDEDDNAPIRPSAISGGEDNYQEMRRRKGKGRQAGNLGEGTGRKRKWLKDRTLSRGITICDREALKGIWRSKVEGTR